jgi:hypothetical protein
MPEKKFLGQIQIGGIVEKDILPDSIVGSLDRLYYLAVKLQEKDSVYTGRIESC